MYIGKRIYYEISTGNVILDTGERQGDVTKTTIEQDFNSYILLKERSRETIGVLELEYGDYSQDFVVSTGYRVDIANNSLVFSYPDPNNPIQSITKPSYEERLSAVEDALLMII